MEKQLVNNDKITCPNCKKQINPVTYLTGELFCPVCKKSLINDSFTIKVDENNSRDFAMSQAFFYYYLQEIERASADNIQNREGIESRGATFLHKAMELCRKSALAGNPYALVNLMFYSESKYDKTIIHSKAFAKICYEKIINSGVDGIEDIIEIARRNMENLECEENDNDVRSTIEILSSTLKDSKNRNLDRTPLFGVIKFHKISVDDVDTLKQLKDILVEARKTWKLYFIVGENATLVTNTTIKNDLNAYFVDEEYETELDEIDKDIVYVAFANAKYRGKYDKKLRLFNKLFGKNNAEYNLLTIKNAIKNRTDITEAIFAENDLIMDVEGVDSKDDNRIISDLVTKL